MASNYAHGRFGREALPALPPEARQCIQRFRRLYEMGLQGPDIFFYYNPFWSTPAGDLGNLFHRQTGVEFFTRVCAQTGSEAARAYLFGLLGHYALDSAVHPYIEKLEKAGEAAHTPLEKEFDRYLLAMDGIAAPHEEDLSSRSRLTRGECVTVAGFYPPATPGQIHQAVGNMRRMTAFLTGKNRDRGEKLLRWFAPKFQAHLIPKEPAEGCARMDSELLARYNRSLRDYPRLVEQVLAHMARGEALGEDFTAIFG